MFRGGVSKNVTGMKTNCTGFASPDLARIVAAIQTIGIPVRSGVLEDDLMLPGVRIDRGALVVDEDRLLYPGDVLHEAGHIAVLPPSERARIIGTLPDEGGQEMAALAWSYAMAAAFDLPLEMVFHDAFKAGGPWLRETFSSGESFGAPLLQLWCMTRVPIAPPGFEHLPLFPKMAKWLRDQDGCYGAAQAAGLFG
jgi:hypothetical protein